MQGRPPGWIGLGAANLVQQPPPVWNRSKEKSEKLLHELGDGKVAIAENIVDVSLRRLPATKSPDQSVQEEIAAVLQARNLYSDHFAYLVRHNSRRRKIFVETSTASSALLGHSPPHDGHHIDVHHVADISECELDLVNHGPVFGSPAMAENATLVVLLSGEYRSKEFAYMLVHCNRVTRHRPRRGRRRERRHSFALSAVIDNGAL
ncbi:hypothetical protein EDB87DRAFT_1828521 [Lactarius vividus]|nr:hypothetical protein EDB87DRAFT_1828521 [Lactarius vividus]